MLVDGENGQLWGDGDAQRLLCGSNEALFFFLVKGMQLFSSYYKMNMRQKNKIEGDCGMIWVFGLI
jgi:hypothetical protein